MRRTVFLLAVIVLCLFFCGCASFSGAGSKTADFTYRASRSTWRAAQSAWNGLNGVDAWLQEKAW